MRKRKAARSKANLKCTGDAKDPENNLKAYDIAGTIPGAFWTLSHYLYDAITDYLFYIILSP